MTVVDRMLGNLNESTENLKAGLDPENLRFWYDVIIRKARDIAPPWLCDKIGFEQDPILPFKFKLNVSRRAVRYLMIAIEENLPKMPYSTGLYFLKVQEEVRTEMDRSLV